MWVLGTASGCSPASLAPALTFGATAVVRDHAPPGADPLVLRAGAWMTWRVKATPTGRVLDTTRGEDAGASTGVAGDGSNVHAERTTAEPACALAAACAWAVNARQDALGRFDAYDARDALDAQEAAP